MGPLEKMDVRYAAGLLDGEGTIRVAKQQFGNHTQYQLHVRMNMTDPRPLLEMQKEFGGSFHWGSPRKNPIHRSISTWNVSSQLALTFLERIRPWLIVKAEEADLAIEFQRAMVTGYPRKAIPANELRRREEIRRKLIELKHRVFDPVSFGMGANSGNSQNGRSRAKQPREIAVGVCNEQEPPATAKMCSELHGDVESMAETTMPRFWDYVPDPGYVRAVQKAVRELIISGKWASFDPDAG